MVLTYGVEIPAAAGPATSRPLAAERRWFEEQGVNFGIVVGPDVVQRPIPFDPIPRQISRTEWAALERGLLQRVLALDEFVRDIFDGQRILRAGRIPAAVYGSPGFLSYASGATARRDGHIRVAVGRDYDDVALVRGIFAGQLPGEPPVVSVVIRALGNASSTPPHYAMADQ